MRRRVPLGPTEHGSCTGQSLHRQRRVAGLADVEDADAAERVVEPDRVARVEPRERVGDLPGRLPVGGPAAGQPEAPGDAVDVRVGRDDEAVGRDARPEAEVERVRADHPAQVEIPALAGRAGGRVRKEEPDGGARGDAAARRGRAGSRRPRCARRRARAARRRPAPRAGTRARRRRARSRPRRARARSRRAARPRRRRRGSGGGSPESASRAKRAEVGDRVERRAGRGPSAARRRPTFCLDRRAPGRTRTPRRSSPRPRGPRPRRSGAGRRSDRSRPSRARTCGTATRGVRRERAPSGRGRAFRSPILPCAPVQSRRGKGSRARARAHRRRHAQGRAAGRGRGPPRRARAARRHGRRRRGRPLRQGARRRRIPTTYIGKGAVEEIGAAARGRARRARRLRRRALARRRCATSRRPGARACASSTGPA